MNARRLKIDRGKGLQNATQEIAAVVRERIQAATKAFPAAG